MVAGGAALVATASLAATSFSPGMALLLGDGSSYILNLNCCSHLDSGAGATVTAAAGGNMVAQRMCLGNQMSQLSKLVYFIFIVLPGPLYCTARSGQCCELILGRRFRCPLSC